MTIPGYKLGPEVGRGGMSVVYKAASEATGETFAFVRQVKHRLTATLAALVENYC